MAGLHQQGLTLRDVEESSIKRARTVDEAPVAGVGRAPTIVTGTEELIDVEAVVGDFLVHILARDDDPLEVGEVVCTG